MGSLVPRTGLQFHRLMYAGVLALSSAMLYLSVRMVFADISAYQASNFLADWFAKDRLTSEKAWDVAHQASLRSIDLYPVPNGDFYYRLGRVLEWRDSQALPGDPQAAHYRKQALQAYRAAATARPDWPYTWSRLAWVKLQLLEFDSEFDAALQNAFAKGAWRWRVNRVLVRTGLLSWRELTAEQKLLITRFYEHLRLQKPGVAEDMLLFSERLHIRGDLAEHIGKVR